jgi:hypothetical protein
MSFPHRNDIRPPGIFLQVQQNLQTPESSGPIDLAERMPEIQSRDLLNGLIHEYAAVAAW